MSTIPNCPITNEQLRDPVQCPNGHSFERTAILQWLSTNQSCPVDRQVLAAHMLVPNRALKDSIDGLTAADTAAAAASVDATADDTGTSSVLTVPLPKLPSSALKLETSVKRLGTDTGNLYHISINPGDSDKRLPVDLVLVMDVSGSMGSQVQCEGAENTGLTILNLVDHACRTVINMLSPEDRLGLVVYDSGARTVLEMSTMDQSGKRKAETASKSMRTGSTTNIWDGMRMGIDMLHRHRKVGRNQALMLLTDGQPSVSPPRGHAAKFKQYKEELGFDCSLFTFGFGYNLDVSEGRGLLLESALEGEGTFGFIPDGSMVGKTFPATMAEILTILGRHVSVALETDPEKIVGTIWYPHTKTSWGLVLNLGLIRNGQTLDVCFTTTDDNLSGTLKYFDPMTDSFQTVDLPAATAMTGKPRVAYRFEMIDVVEQALFKVRFGDFNGARAILSEFCSKVDVMRFPPELLQDLVGEISTAFLEQKHFSRWGKYYVPALLNAHLFQICPNYKDPGLQSYGGTLSRRFRELGDQIFEQLPPPEVAAPSSYGYSSGSRSSYSRTSYTPPSMSQINNGGCFTGEGRVKLHNATVKRVDELVQGDTLENGATIQCVVKTVYPQGSTRRMVTFGGGLTITEWHPVRMFDTWRFPIEMLASKSTKVDAVYTLVLDREHFVTVSGVDCITLGHGLTEGVLEHSYFGTPAVLDDLRQFPGWEHGLVTLTPKNIVRENGQVRFVPPV